MLLNPCGRSHTHRSSWCTLACCQIVGNESCQCQHGSHLAPQAQREQQCQASHACFCCRCMLGTASRTLLQRMALQPGRSLWASAQQCALRAAHWLLRNAYLPHRLPLQLTVSVCACLTKHNNCTCAPEALLDHETFVTRQLANTQHI